MIRRILSSLLGGGSARGARGGYRRGSYGRGSYGRGGYRRGRGTGGGGIGSLVARFLR